MNDPETDIFVRIPNNDVLDLIVDGGFKTAHELGSRPGIINDEARKRYFAKREAVELEMMGYPTDSKGNERPIYGYAGSNNIFGKEHDEVGESYGKIAVKMKKEVKGRSTFTGSDSFKSGVASKIKTYTGDADHDDTPPPDVASLVSHTKYGNPEAIKSTVERAAKAENIDDLARACTPRGFSYVECQMHGGVSFKDIDSIYLPEGDSYKPSSKLLEAAKKNKVKIYVGDKLFKY